MSAESEIVRILRGGGKLNGRDIHVRGSFHDLQGTLAKLQEMSQPKGILLREKPENSGVFVYWMKNGAAVPADVELDDEEPRRNGVHAPAIASSKGAKAPSKPADAVTTPLQGDIPSGKKLYQHLFRVLDRLERKEIDRNEALAHAKVGDVIVKLAQVQLLYEQLRVQKNIPEKLTDMPLVDD